MNRKFFIKATLTVLVAVLALTMFQGRHSQAARSKAVADGPDFSSELRVLNTYGDDLVTYSRDVARLNKKESLVSADVDPLQRKSDDLKRRLSEVQNAIREVVRKLKAANEWDNLDATVVASLGDGSVKTLFQQESFKRLLEDAAGGLSSHASEIGAPLEGLRKKLASRALSPFDSSAELPLVRASYEAPSPMAFVSVSCTVGKIRLGLIHRLGGKPTGGTLDQVSCACNPSAGIGLGTGAACSTVN